MYSVCTSPKYLKKPHPRVIMPKEIENWDDDDEFGDIDESNFLSSVSSAGSKNSEVFYQRPLSASDAAGLAAAGRIQYSGRIGSVNSVKNAKNMSNLKNFTDLDDFNDNYENDFTDLTTKISKLDRNRKKSIDYSTFTGTVKQLNNGGSSEHYGGAFSDELNDHFDDDVQTIRVSSGRNASPADNISIRNGEFYQPPVSVKKKNKSISFDEDTEFIFDDNTDNLEERLNRATKSRLTEELPSSIDSLDDSFAFRNDSRLSTYSLSTSATTYTDTEDETDFGFSKEADELFDKPLVLQKRLQEVRHQNELDSERDRELLAKGRKYDTIRSNGSGNSIKGNLEDTVTVRMLEDFEEQDDDLLSGFELNDNDSILSNLKGTLHKNVVIKQAAANQKNSRQTSRKTPRETQSTLDFHKPLNQPDSEKPRYNAVRIKTSMPVLRPNQRLSSGRGVTNSPQKGRYQQQMQETRRISMGSPTKPHTRPKRSDIVEEEELGNITIDASSTLAIKHPPLLNKRLRPVQSMQNIHPPEIRHRQFTKAKRAPIFEQNVLDQFDDLNVDVDKENKFSVVPKGKGYPYGTIKSNTIKHVPLDTYREKIPQRKVRESKQQQLPPSTARSPTKSSLLKDNSQKKRSTPKRKVPALIRNLGFPTAIIEESTEMHFNPNKLVWEGNDIELKKFDSVNPKTPGLIAFISNKAQQVVGDMIFDPDRLCWINTKEEHSDPFEGLDDLEVSTNNRLHRSTVASAAVMAAHSLATSIGGDFSVGEEFNLNSKFIDKLRHDDERWIRKTKGWFSPNEEIDREYLQEIRSMVMRR